MVCGEGMRANAALRGSAVWLIRSPRRSPIVQKCPLSSGAPRCAGIHLSIHYPQVVWDPAKAKANLAAHGVSFAEAATVLDDERAITREDEHSVGENRFITLGLSGAGNLLIVVYSWRGETVIRLISAWKANARQRRQYAQSAR